jgi:hypothetical protein
MLAATAADDTVMTTFLGTHHPCRDISKNPAQIQETYLLYGSDFILTRALLTSPLHPSEQHVSHENC